MILLLLKRSAASPYTNTYLCQNLGLSSGPFENYASRDLDDSTKALVWDSLMAG